MWPSLHTQIRKHIVISDKDLEKVSSRFVYRKFRKKQFILQEGDVCRFETFILKGCCRTYELDEKGQEHILQFAPEDWWAGNLYSFLTETASTYAIDCLEDCEVLQISKQGLEELYSELPVMERYFRIIIQNAFIALQKRVLTNLSKPAVDRYKEFIEKYPQIENRVPDHQIASFLGLTPQSLSRIRSQFRR
jgi:CRP-like cAMP-binding protein